MARSSTCRRACTSTCRCRRTSASTRRTPGQFERTLIIADEGSSVHYVEGCSAPVYSTDSLHSAVVELIAKPGARIRYTTIQNWSPNVYNLVTKRARAETEATVEWIDGNLGSKLTMKYPAVVMTGPKAHGEVLSVAYAGPGQHQDAGAKMTHAAPETTSIIDSKSISKDGGRTTYRGLVRVEEGAHDVKSHVRCDALILDEESRCDTYPYMEIEEKDARIGHEATVSKVGDDQLFYLQSRGLTEQQATAMIVNGFIEPITKTLPMEYAVELSRLIELNMEGAVGLSPTMTAAFTVDAARALGGPDWLVARRVAAAERLADDRVADAAARRSGATAASTSSISTRYRPFAGRGARRARRRARAGRRAVGGRGRRARGDDRRARRPRRAPRDRSRARSQGRARLRHRDVRRRARAALARAGVVGDPKTRSRCCTTRSSPAARSSTFPTVSSSRIRSSCCTGAKATARHRSRTRSSSLGERAEATVLDRFGSPETDHLVDAVTELLVGDDAHLRYLSVQEHGPRTWHLGFQRAHVGRDATLRIVGGRARRRLRAVAQRSAARTARAPRATSSRSTSATATRCSTSARSRTTTRRGRAATCCSRARSRTPPARSTPASCTCGRPRRSRTRPRPTATSCSPKARARSRSRTSRSKRTTCSARTRRRSARSTTTSSTTSRRRGIPPEEAERLIVLGFFDDVFARLPVERADAAAAAAGRRQARAPAGTRRWVRRVRRRRGRRPRAGYRAPLRRRRSPHRARAHRRRLLRDRRRVLARRLLAVRGRRVGGRVRDRVPEARLDVLAEDRRAADAARDATGSRRTTSSSTATT